MALVRMCLGMNAKCRHNINTFMLIVENACSLGQSNFQRLMATRCVQPSWCRLHYICRIHYNLASRVRGKRIFNFNNKNYWIFTHIHFYNVSTRRSEKDFHSEYLYILSSTISIGHNNRENTYPVWDTYKSIIFIW